MGISWINSMSDSSFLAETEVSVGVTVVDTVTIICSHDDERVTSCDVSISNNPDVAVETLRFVKEVCKTEKFLASMTDLFKEFE